MTELFQTFADNLLPILLISGAGFLLGKLLSVDSRALGRVIFYVFSPALVFTLIKDTKLPYDKILLIVGFALSVMFISGGLALLAGKIMRFERPVLMAVLLTAMFANTGNYGMPVIKFAFGEEALAYASVYFVTVAITFNTVGVLIASLGHLNWKEALLGLLKVPVVYAIVAAVLVLEAGWILPAPLDRTTELLSNAAIPAMLILLGLELQRVEWSRQVRALTLSTAIRLLIGPAVGLGLAALFGLSGPTRQAGVLEASMPSAVLTTVLASEYRLEPSLVTSIVFVSTLFSPLTLTPLLVLLGG